MKKVCLFLFLLLLVGIGYMSAQVVIGGRITSKEDGQPVPYVVISVKGSTKYNALSDDAGKYTISLPSSDLTLTYSMVGFITKEIKLSGQHVVDVVLDTDSKTLDDVIVVAYGTARKSTFTGSASNLSASAIKDVPTTSFENALSGRIPGLKITQGSGQAGSTSSIRIRGTGSMNASNEPLYVIDGVPVTSGDASQLSYVSSNVMNSLNPNDIENITVLKDAAASSLYGSRAANGVILITTKRGKAGKAKVNLKMNVGFTPAFATKNLEIASPEQQAELMYENRYNEYIDSGKTEAEAQAWAEARVNANIAPDPRGFYSWEDVLLRTASYQDYDVSVSGGTEATSYYTSLGYTRNDGRMVNNDMNRFSGRLNLTQKISPIVSIGTNVNFSNVKKTGFNDTRNTGSNYFYAVRNLLFEQWWPTDENGDWVTSRYPSYAQNYLYYDKYKEISSKMMKLSAVETATVNILPELQFKTIFSYDLTRIDDHEYYAPIHYLSVSAKNGGSVSDYSTRIEKIVSSNTLSYNKTFNSVHNVGAVIGYEAERNKINYSGSSGVGLPNNSLSVVSAAGTLSGSAYFNEDNMISYLSKVDYNYADRYYLAGSFRRDGSSRFGSNNRWGNFWSVSGSWRLIQEEFMSGIEWLSNLRVRASYGVNGTMPTNRYGHLSLYSYGYNYNASAGGALVTLADPNLSWESNYTSNFGIESSFLDNRLNFNVEYYNRTTKDLLQDVQTSKITGFTKYLANIGQINNKGFEFELSGDIVRTKDLTLNAGLNLSTLKSKVVKLNNGEDVIWYDPTGDNDNQLIYREGYSPLSLSLIHI